MVLVSGEKLAGLNETAAAVSGALLGLGTALSIGTKTTGLTNQIAALEKKFTGQSPIFTYSSPMAALQGIFNTATVAGIGLIITDYVIKELIGSSHGYKYAEPWVRDLGIGLFGGGIVGGVLDPATGVRTNIAPYSASRGLPSIASGQRLGFAGI